MVNILILSVGTRNKLLRYFKENISGKVIATDNSEIAPAIYEADKYYIVPRITEKNYLDIILDICKKENINAVLSLIDPELNLLAENKKRFSDIGVTVIGSSFELCERSFNKMYMYKWLCDNGYSCAKSFDSKEEFVKELNNGTVSFPVIVKPIYGSASLHINEANNMAELDVLMNQNDRMMIQEKLNGQEIGADVYIDMISEEIVSIFTKEKIRMRAGETDKSVSFKDPVLFEFIEKFVKQSGYTGQIDIDIFRTDKGYCISEVNPRFGGGYPHAYECGCNHIKLIENNANGIKNDKHIGEYEVGVYMMKYNDIVIKKNEKSLEYKKEH